jgi:sulfite reductase beta subunit-like hemoprotein
VFRLFLIFAALLCMPQLAMAEEQINERVTQFRDQTERFLKGEIPDDKFRTLRLMNGLYVQTHAPLLRVAGPYGLLCGITENY